MMAGGDGAEGICTQGKKEPVDGMGSGLEAGADDGAEEGNEEGDGATCGCGGDCLKNPVALGACVGGERAGAVVGGVGPAEGCGAGADVSQCCFIEDNSVVSSVTH